MRNAILFFKRSNSSPKSFLRFHESRALKTDALSCVRNVCCGQHTIPASYACCTQRMYALLQYLFSFCFIFFTITSIHKSLSFFFLSYIFSILCAFIYMYFSLNFLHLFTKNIKSTTPISFQILSFFVVSLSIQIIRLLSSLFHLVM